MQTKALADIEERKVPAQPCIVIHAKRSVAEIPAFLGDAYRKLYEYAGIRTEPGMPFARYYSWESEPFELEAGVIVKEALIGADEIQPSTFGGYSALYALYKGPYAEIANVYEAMQEYMKERHLELAGPCVEIYLNDPSTVPESELLTEVYWPIK